MLTSWLAVAGSDNLYFSSEFKMKKNIQYLVGLVGIFGVLQLLHAEDAPDVAEAPKVFRDLADKNPQKLSLEDLQKLLPGAKMSRLTNSGNTNRWTNDTDGTFIISSDNRSSTGAYGASYNSTAPGKWHISEDGRYCVLIDWKRVDTEEWCRYIYQTSLGYYATKSDKTGTERVYRLEIKH